MATPVKLSVEVVTAERVVYQRDNVDMVLAPGADGELGILPQHAALFSLLSAGEMLVRVGTEEQPLVVFGGFIQVRNDQVLVLADAAEHIEEIDVERAEAARRRAEEQLQRRESGEVDAQQALATLRHSQIRIQAAGGRGRRRRRSASGSQPGQSSS